MVEATKINPNTKAIILVSIPERVLGWLKHRYKDSGKFVGKVSIPERVLGWLKL